MQALGDSESSGKLRDSSVGRRSRADSPQVEAGVVHAGRRMRVTECRWTPEGCDSSGVCGGASRAGKIFMEVMPKQPSARQPSG